jgi:hypothetical protein
MKIDKTIKVLFVVSLLAVSVFLVSDFAFSAEQSGNIYINMTVPTIGGGGGGSTDTIFPVISDVTSTVNYTTSTVSWVATDNTLVQNCTFDYGQTEMYGYAAMPDINISTYSVGLTGLATGTTYYYVISCYDPSSNGVSATGTFTTLSPGFINRLFVIAKPEKRVPKIGGNNAVNATLLFYNSVTKALVHTKDIFINDAGTSTVQDAAIPTGNFEVVFKGESHLAKRIVGVSIENGYDTTLDFTEAGDFYLLAGDVQGTGLKDNFVDILDISAEDIKFNSHDLVFDLNRDGIVDVLDMSAVLVNYNKGGDPM